MSTPESSSAATALLDFLTKPPGVKIELSFPLAAELIRQTFKACVANGEGRASYKGAMLTRAECGADLIAALMLSHHITVEQIAAAIPRVQEYVNEQRSQS